MSYVPNNKYQQPYSNKYVITNSTDPARNELPVYMRRFPRFLHGLYKRQVPYSPNNMQQLAIKQPAIVRDELSPAPPPTTPQQQLRLQLSRKMGSVDVKPARSTSASLPTSKTPQINSGQERNNNQQPFKTMGVVPAQPEASKSLSKTTSTLSAMPSDFEHIFHYSETQ